MDVNVEAFMGKVKKMANKTSEAASMAADAAGRKAGEIVNTTRANIKIFDLNAECEVLFKEIGRMVYDLHQGAEVLNDAMDAKIAEVDAKQEQIAELRREMDGRKFTVTCSGCGKLCSPEDAYCSGCGSKL